MVVSNGMQLLWDQARKRWEKGQQQHRVKEVREARTAREVGETRKGSVAKKEAEVQEVVVVEDILARRSKVIK